MHRTSHQKTARLYADYRPEVLCSGHGLFTNVAPEGYDMFLQNATKLTELFDALLPEQSGITGLEPSWLQIYPYQSAGQPGETVELEVHVHNPLEAKCSVAWRWVLPEGWTADPAQAELLVHPGERALGRARVSIGSGYRFLHPKVAIALDVELDRRALGQITEAVVENRPYGAASVRPAAASTSDAQGG